MRATVWRRGEWAVVGLWLLAAPAAQAVTLAWDPSTGATGYRLSYGDASGAYTKILEVGPATQAVVSGLTPGVTYYFAATAYNAVAESDFSNEVSYRVPVSPPDTTPPTVAITAPLDGATVPRKAEVMIEAEASDNVGVAHVDIYVNGVLQCADGTPPYGCRWRVPAAPGHTYTLAAQAFDAAGHQAISPAVRVTSAR